MLSSTEQTTSSKVCLRNNKITGHYKIERELPAILHTDKNHGNRSGTVMSQSEWNLFCDKIDDTFWKTNILQTIVFYGGLIVVLMGILYLVLVTFTPLLSVSNIWIGISTLITLMLLAVALVLSKYCVLAMIDRECLDRARALCREETSKLGLGAKQGSIYNMTLCESDGSVYIRISATAWTDVEAASVPTAVPLETIVLVPTVIDSRYCSQERTSQRWAQISPLPPPYTEDNANESGRWTVQPYVSKE